MPKGKKVVKVNKKTKKNNRNVKRNTKKVKTLKIHYGRILLFLIVIAFIIYLVATFVNFPIKNIYITGNTILTDQEIIEMLGIENYPSIFSSTTYELKKKLNDSPYIKNVKIEKKKLKEIHIKIVENKPLYYNLSTKETVLETGDTVALEINVPVLINYVPDTISDLFLEKMQTLDEDVLSRISEIKYDPNDVDEERFLFYMNDGNYIYTTLEKFSDTNDYVQIKKSLNGKKGILYLDSGEYFQIIDE